ncbi:unnamed protein product [Brachionus calyciflorus]|uniref:Chitin-binding type-2 domain-containing protein n=1 Tax=Brachionus calyciflorus TaxID=104777 RepID=A0A813MQH4_9BILA|nr:unnamed protein product [Brachionus calyciflorus]
MNTSKTIIFVIFCLIGSSFQQSSMEEKIEKQLETEPVPVQTTPAIPTSSKPKISELETVQSKAKIAQIQPVPVFFQAESVPVQPVIAPVGPYVIQQQTITNTGETIIENLIGGVLFDCRTRPTGHWRDSNYCDIFHACVFGSQKKSYACPFVGERTYFDEVTRRCEFVRSNPQACLNSIFYH